MIISVVIGSITYVLYSGDGVNAAQPAVPCSPSKDTVNVTQLYSGNESAFMDMTTSIGGLMPVSTADELESPVLSPALEQENNVNLGGREVGLVDAHNKSVFFEDDRDVSLTFCGASDELISLESNPPAVIPTSYAAPAERGLNKTVTGGESDDMEMTQCLPLNASANVDQDLELTQCLPLDASANIKSSCRWPFGKRQDSRKERISGCEDSRVDELVSLGERRSFVPSNELDVSHKVDTTELLMELNTMQKTPQAREFDSMLRQMSESSFTSVSTCHLPSANITSVCSVSPTSITNDKTLHTHPMSIGERTFEHMLDKITDSDDTKKKDEHDRLLNSFSAIVDAVKSEQSVTGCVDISTDNTTASFIKPELGVIQDGLLSTNFDMETAREINENQTAACVASSNLSVTTAVASCPPDHVSSPSTAQSFSVSAVANQVDGDTRKLEKSSNEAGCISQSAKEMWKVDDVSMSFGGKVRFGADAVESLFADKDSDKACTINSTFVDDVSLITSAANSTMQTAGIPASGLAADTNLSRLSAHERIVSILTETSDLKSSNSSTFVGDVSLTAAVTGATLTAEQMTVFGIQAKAGSCYPGINPLPFVTCTSGDYLLSSQTIASAQKPLKSALPSMAQSADDLLTRVKLASSMPYQVTTNVDNSAAKAYHTSRVGNSAVNPTAVYCESADKSVTISFSRQASSASAVLERPKELAQTASVQVDVSGFGSAMEISAQPVEMTDTLPTYLASFNSTTNLDSTKTEEMRLEAILNAKSQLISSGGDDGDKLETSKAGIVELPSSAKLSSQLELPAIVTVGPLSDPEYCEESTMLPVPDVSQSSVFSSSPTHTQVPAQDAGLTPNNKVRGIFGCVREGVLLFLAGCCER